MKRIALAILLAPLVAHATLGVVTGGALLKSASKVAIAMADGHGRGKVVTAYRGVKVGEVIDVPVDVAGAALLVCDGDDCAAAIDMGGYYVLHLPGRKGPIVTLPGVFETSAIPGLVAGTGAKPLCVHVHVHFIDDPSADGVLDGSFSAENGTGTLKGKLLGAKPLAATLTVGGPTHLAAEHATVRFESGVALSGGAFVRESGGCFVMSALPTPLSRTPARFGKDVGGSVTAFPIARGTATSGGRATPIPIEISNDGTLTSTLIPNGTLIDFGTAMNAVALAYRDGTKTFWVTFSETPTQLPAFATPAARLAVLLADGKPHGFRVALALGDDRTAHPSTISGQVTGVADP